MRIAMMPSQYPWVGAWLKSHGHPGSQLQFLNQAPLIDHVSVILSSSLEVASTTTLLEAGPRSCCPRPSTGPGQERFLYLGDQLELARRELGDVLLNGGHSLAKLRIGYPSLHGFGALPGSEAEIAPPV